MSKNTILKWWFYFLSDFSEKLEVSVSLESEKVVIFDDWKSDLENIEITSNTDVKIFWFCKKSINRNIIRNWEKTKILVNYIFLWKNEEKIDSKVNWKIIKSWNNLEINILWILDDKSILKLDSGVNIEKWVIWWNWLTNSEIIFLSDFVKFSWVPWLLVQSNDVKANHSLKIDKISDESIFYLQARWIEQNESRNIILKAKVDNIYKYLKLCNEKLYKNILDEIFLK